MVQGALRQLGVEDGVLEDASQEVFLVLARRFAEYDAQRSLASWLWGIARGVASTQRRGLRRRRRLEASVAAQPEVGCPSLDDTVARGQARDMLRAFLDGLDEDKCAVFVLAEIDGCSGPEIAARLGVNLNTVYARLRAARFRFDDTVEQRRRAIASASAWWGLRWSTPKAAAISMSTMVSAALIVPSLELAPEPPRGVAPVVALGDPEIEWVALARKSSGSAKVRGEHEAPAMTEVTQVTNMTKTLPTIALAAALSAPAAAQAKPRTAPEASAIDQDADDAALVSDLETREYIFDGDTVDGEVLGPAGESVTARVNVHHQSLIRIRGHFIAELITLATDV